MRVAIVLKRRGAGSGFPERQLLTAVLGASRGSSNDARKRRFASTEGVSKEPLYNMISTLDK